MRLLLRETVENLGTIGDIVSVPNGFGRNFLVPAGKAVPVTPDNVRMIERRKLQLLEEEAKRRGQLQKIADILAGKSFKITAKAAGEEGKLYGSVAAQQIAEVIAKEGFAVEPKMILLDRPIKEVGIFEVRLRLMAGVECTTKVWIVEEVTEA